MSLLFRGGRGKSLQMLGSRRSYKKRSFDPSPTLRRRRLGWTALGAASILLVAVGVGWQWLVRPRPDASFGTPETSPDSPPTGAPEAGGGQTLLYLAQMEEAERHASQGDFRGAARSYQRALIYATSKAEAQRGLLTSLLGVSVRESPEAANQLAGELLRERPDDPALLITFTDTARLLDNVYGEEGMEGALKRLERVLDAQSEDPSLGK